jgi:phage gp29-like protein
MEKCLHFRTSSRKNNPEGRSILRNAYRSWYFKKHLQEVEGIGIERDLAGLPVLQPPEGVEIWDQEDPEMVRYLQYAEQLVSNVRRDNKEGIVLPFGWNFELMNGGSRRQFEVGSVIDRYDNRMAMTVLADFIFLGHEQTGSFALSSDKTTLFATAIGSYLDEICEVFNLQAIPKLIDLNADKFRGLTDYPVMEHTDVEKPDIATISAFLKDMVGVGVLQPDEGLEDYVRDLGSLPDRVEGAPMPGVDDQQDSDNHHQDDKNGSQSEENTQQEKQSEEGQKIDSRQDEKVEVKGL